MREDTPLEKSLENSVTRWCKKNGILHRKMNGLGNRDWPDQFCYSKRFRPGTKGVFIEMKREGHCPTEQQYMKLEELRGVGFEAEWFDSARAAIAFLKGFLK